MELFLEVFRQHPAERQFREVNSEDLLIPDDLDRAGVLFEERNGLLAELFLMEFFLDLLIVLQVVVAQKHLV